MFCTQHTSNEQVGASSCQLPFNEMNSKWKSIVGLSPFGLPNSPPAASCDAGRLIDCPEACHSNTRAQSSSLHHEFYWADIASISMFVMRCQRHVHLCWKCASRARSSECSRDGNEEQRTSRAKIDPIRKSTSCLDFHKPVLHLQDHSTTPLPLRGAYQVRAS